MLGCIFAVSQYEIPFHCRPIVTPISTIFENIFCGRRSPVPDEGQDYELGKPLPGSDPVEASRRRYIWLEVDWAHHIKVKVIGRCKPQDSNSNEYHTSGSFLLIRWRCFESDPWMVCAYAGSGVLVPWRKDLVLLQREKQKPFPQKVPQRQTWTH